jgi:hypothetical protein
MAEQPKARPTAVSTDNREKPSSPTRRRWLQAGLSAPPVLMTVISRPVLAAQCVPPSAYVSLGASAPGMYAACAGNGPQFWSNPNTVWPSPYRRETHFNRIFAPPAVSSPSPHGPTLLAVLENSSGTYNDVARYVVAALLNSAGSPPLVPTSILGLPTIKHIWTESVGGVGSFTPSRGASWSPAEIVDYLKSTMTPP